MAENGRGRCLPVMVGEGSPSTPCGVDFGEGVNDGPEPVSGLVPGSRQHDRVNCAAYVTVLTPMRPAPARMGQAGTAAVPGAAHRAAAISGTPMRQRRHPAAAAPLPRTRPTAAEPAGNPAPDRP